MYNIRVYRYMATEHGKVSSRKILNSLSKLFYDTVFKNEQLLTSYKFYKNEKETPGLKAKRLENE